MKSTIPQKVAKVRRDITSYLFHFVNREAKPPDTLRSILNDGFVRGGIYSPSTAKTVCFTEAPLAEVVREDGILDSHTYKRLSLWGIGFTKKSIFERGGLPVIYQPRRLLCQLQSDSAWRHVDFDLTTGLDYSWQRERRIRCDEFHFESESAILVVPKVDEFVEELWQYSVSAEMEDRELTYHGGLFKKWDFIPLEHADISHDSGIEVCLGEDFRDLVTEEYSGRIDIDGP